LNGINAGEREKGPLILESYSSTVVSEAARVLVVSSGLICLPDAPEEYLKKADLFDFIRRMPATWGESRVINSAIGQNITTARRYGNEWFVGSVIDETGGELSIPLDFLASNIVYDVTYYEDAADTHCVTNRESYQIRQGTVTLDDTITATLAPGGGHCMWIRPQKSLTLTEQGVSITWDSSEEETYRIDRTGMLVSNHWNAVASNEVEGIWTDSSAETQTAENLFYRILPEANGN
jgi:alpha-glucosidase